MLAAFSFNFMLMLLCDVYSNISGYQKYPKVCFWLKSLFFDKTFCYHVKRPIDPYDRKLIP